MTDDTYRPDPGSAGGGTAGETAEQRRAREARTAAAKTFTAPKGATKIGDGMPSMKDFPDDLPGFQEAMRKHRENLRKEPTRAAVAGMLKEKTDPKK